MFFVLLVSLRQALRPQVCVFFLYSPPIPLSLSIFLSVLDIQLLRSVTLLFATLLHAWLETVHTSTYFISRQRVFTSQTLKTQESGSELKKEDLSETGE